MDDIDEVFFCCDCDNLSQHLLNFITGILSEKSEFSLLKLFKIFISEFCVNNQKNCLPHDSMHRHNNLIPCSQTFFNNVRNAIKNFICEDKELLTMLIHLVSAYLMEEPIYTRCFNKGYFVDDILRNLRNHSYKNSLKQDYCLHVLAAFHGESKFMEILVKSDMVSSLPNESYFLDKETQTIVGDFM